jgi:hypothetical protein
MFEWTEETTRWSVLGPQGFTSDPTQGDTWVNVAFWHATYARELWYRCPNGSTTSFQTQAGAGGGGDPSQRFVVTVDRRRRTYALRVESTSGFVVTTAALECDGRYTRTETSQTPLVFSTTGRLPPGFAASRTISGETAILGRGPHSFAVWSLTLDDPGYDLTPPRTVLRASPPRATARRSATFRFSASEAGATFHCALDRTGWTPCRSPKAYRGLRVGRHVFRVRAQDRAGNVDASPVRYVWTIIRR